MTLEILLVEDNPADVDLMLEAFKSTRLTNPLRVAKDGAEALRILRHQGEHAGAELPGLIFLDLDLPKLTGREVMEEMKRDPQLARIPIVVLTGSKRDQDLMVACNLQATAYLVKPIDWEKLVTILGSLSGFTLTLQRAGPAA